jgi:ribonuclease P protein component
MGGQYSLGKNERLKSRKLIERLFKEAKSFNSFPFRVYYLVHAPAVAGQQPSAPVQFGVGAGTRNFKSAVHRNKIKRQTREAWRLQKNVLCDLLNEKRKRLSVFFIYTQKELPDYKTIYAKTGLIVNKLAKLVYETDPSDT